ncbi:MAG TPA: ParB/RepB/Spo0J family partition protein [Noviherbaspirillum sp.]|jgi:ParB family chromosome partitioning protein|uniref:ParB/RepB/Spo0J family partition protein n=1 Tax=Noviherbaspirillum sp. TaxID=1926288 RepID=UPI002F94E0DB
MSIKDRLAAKAASIGNNPRAPGEATAPRAPKTAPGQLMSSLPFLAEKEREIEELQAKLRASEGAGMQELPLNELVEVEGRRRTLNGQQYEELKANLRSNELVHPIVVRKNGEGRYEIISGHNRVAIFRELGRDRIKATVLDADEYLAEASAVYANLFHSELPDFGKYLGFTRLLTLTGKTQKEVAAASGADEKSVSRWLSFGDLPQAAIALVAAAPEKLGGTSAMALAALAREGKEAAVVEAVRGIVEGKYTQEAGVRFARSGGQAPARPRRGEPMTIRSGKTVFCKLVGAGQTLRVDFKSEEDRLAAETAIRDVLERLARQS